MGKKIVTGSRIKMHSAVVLLLGIVALSGCRKQPKPAPIVPAPTIPASAMIPPPEGLPPSDVTPETSQPAEPVANATKPKPRPRNGRKITDLKPSAGQTQANTSTPQPPVTSPETSPPPRITASSHDVPTTAAISEGLPHSDEMHRKETAAQLNQSTEDNLRSLTRALTSAEKSIVEQIRNFMAQSQEAMADNDVVRAHNLALKAHLLSDELTNH
jgi:hypothetical protein